MVSGDKESCVVLIDNTDYHDKLQKMIDDGIKNGICKVAKDNTLNDLKLFKSFLCINFTKHKHHEECFQNLNKPRQLYGTAKTHKFSNIDKTTIDNLKFRPIIHVELKLLQKN